MLRCYAATYKDTFRPEGKGKNVLSYIAVTLPITIIYGKAAAQHGATVTVMQCYVEKGKKTVLGWKHRKVIMSGVTIILRLPALHR